MGVSSLKNVLLNPVMACPANTVFLPELPTNLFKTSYLEYRPTNKQRKETRQKKSF